MLRICLVFARYICPVSVLYLPDIYAPYISVLYLRCICASSSYQPCICVVSPLYLLCICAVSALHRFHICPISSPYLPCFCAVSTHRHRICSRIYLVSVLYLPCICSVSAHYLLKLNTVSTPFLPSIYSVSILHLQRICLKSCNICIASALYLFCFCCEFALYLRCICHVSALLLSLYMDRLQVAWRQSYCQCQREPITEAPG